MAAPSDPNTQQQTPSASRPATGDKALSSTPVEMASLPAASLGSAALNTGLDTPEMAKPTSSATPAPPQITEVPPGEGIEASPTAASSSRPVPPVDLSRSETEAIGPSTDTPAANPDNSNGPVVVIMLLLTTGARHPYKIDERYLKKRNVTVDDMDPYNISVYTLKELIWRDWREEWEPRPTSPSSIRLIHFGRMLDDKSPLKDCRFQTEAPNVVHMTIKPQEVVDEEDARTGKGGARRDGDDEVQAGCRCVIL